MKKPTVAIIMSTYNGENYLREQIESLLQQERVEVSIFVRDDGSQDTTLEILESYKEHLIFVKDGGQNRGVGNSFMEALYQAGLEYDYYAFCDQDDVWLPNKLLQAIEMIGSIPKPTLYCSNQLLVNQDLEQIGLRHQRTLDTSSLQILNDNLVTGCTMVWNQALQELLHHSPNRPSSELLTVRIHDVWVAMVASAVGEILYDSNAFIYYRQHEQNVVGVRKENIYVNWYKKLRNKSKRNGRSLLAQEVVEKFEDMMGEPLLSELKIVSAYQRNFLSKLALIRNSHIFSLSNESKWALRLKIIFNLI
ncbi:MULTISPECIES: glycosyltransferase family 2 protein [unclassified Streptococcus]|uniref:glycosyltransferase family 2 protein n=1 Tax=unclassified Streptococcus TaxID=2608887 RepID=UPI0010717ABA|nr:MULTISPECIES: glycosyltransferase family 2 protein [unclassified Streptococcus]MBF0786617.1 glycosyltransferase family 2 protein [Streptococcus sp. 19428wC2_LYSM12]MCQ9212818.1 glycosyltransferase family 2 protein [Streptococcus sp. B01]MCQ9214159.1 glycosyltransferase family 2 protein [Streptococcus sp. O1]TFV06576.1 glycosyltransferase family 2 protein [Streptococcus sp. LYSM12]